MPKIPESVKEAWEGRAGAVVFSTAASDGTPNSIYATCVGLYNDEEIIVADNYFDKTIKNIKAGSTGSILFITEEKKSFQIKGTIEYHKEGEIFDFMKSWNPEKHPGHGAATIKIDSVWSGSEKLA